MHSKHTSKPTQEAKIEDSQLWQEFQSGSEVAFARIYRDNVSLLYNYGLKLVKDKNLIKDCIQNLFIEIWDTKHKLSSVKSIKSYLFKSLRRKLISEVVLRRTTFNETIKASTTHNIVHSIEHSLAEKQAFDQQQLRLKEAIKKLTDRQREVVYLKYYAQLSYVEIGEIMCLSKKGTYKLMGRSIHFLRKHMGTFTFLALSLIPD
ncbi:RNA polymerase sigma factor [Flagellimonas pacifica]|uniref:RNA polymerase sigma factor n=1 Tax=Flagellimonas pacifica TaxID=1247520 RepID=UPI0013FD4179|nr:sigma-70 family RNA polymerase sigma factor [Allomuricauda parva]